MSYQITGFGFPIAFPVLPTGRRAVRIAATLHPSSPSSRLRIPTAYSDLPPASDPIRSSIADNPSRIRNSFDCSLFQAAARRVPSPPIAAETRNTCSDATARKPHCHRVAVHIQSGPVLTRIPPCNFASADDRFPIQPGGFMAVTSFLRC